MDGPWCLVSQLTFYSVIFGPICLELMPTHPHPRHPNSGGPVDPLPQPQSFPGWKLSALAAILFMYPVLP